MSVFMTFLMILLIVFAVLGIALAIVFVQLGRELQKLGESTETMKTKTQRAIKKVQLLIPAAIFIKNTSGHLVQRLRGYRQKGSPRRGASIRKK